MFSTSSTMSSFRICSTNRILGISCVSLIGLISYMYFYSHISTNPKLPIIFSTNQKPQAISDVLANREHPISDSSLENQRLDKLAPPDTGKMIPQKVQPVQKLVFKPKIVEEIQDEEREKLLPGQIQMVVPKILPNRSFYAVVEDELERNRTCKSPYIYPYEAKALSMIKEDLERVQTPHCLSTPTQKFTTDQNTKLFRKNSTDDFWKASNCCYVPFVGIGFKKLQKYKNLTECIDIIEDTTTIPSVFANIQVLCFDSSGNLTYRDYFHFFRLNKTLEMELDEKLYKTSEYRPSVLVLGLDTVSFTNFQRFLPKSRNFILKDLGAIEFSGMNKVGLGTTENVIPMISNCGYHSIRETIFPGPNEDCTQIWERFSDIGYRTVQSVEEHWTLVNEKMKRNGRGQANTTYSNLDFAQGVQRTAPSALEEYGCFEHQWAFDILSDRILQVARKLRKKPYFHFAWSVLESHQLIGMSQILDAPLLKMMKTMTKEKLFEDTIFMLLSDHGMVSARYAITAEGKVEANKPFLYVVLPKRFREKYTAAVSNMKRNSNGLVTPYDIHQTFLSVLNLSSVTNRHLRSVSEPVYEPVGPDSEEFSPENSAGPTEFSGEGISLFKPIPLNRSCTDALVPKQYCLCWYWIGMKDFESDRTVQNAAKFTVDYINQHLQSYPDCVPLKLTEVTGAEKTSDTFGNDFLRISFGTMPNKAEFQAIVSRKFKPSQNGGNSIFENGGNLKFELIGDVERKNKYGKQSSCLSYEMQMVGWIRSVCLCKQFKMSLEE